jgi:hypothetical protein
MAGTSPRSDRQRVAIIESVTPSAFADRSAADRYVLARLAIVERVPLADLVALSSAELDRRLPGARTTYEHRGEIAATLIRNRGIDPTSADFQVAQAQAQAILRRVDELAADD